MPNGELFKQILCWNFLIVILMYLLPSDFKSASSFSKCLLMQVGFFRIIYLMKLEASVVELWQTSMGICEFFSS